MILKTCFIFASVKYDYVFDTEKIDRNYDDEAYGYWIVPLKDDAFFEVNILKEMVKGEWVWSLRGYVAYYDSTEQTGPTSCKQIDFSVWNM